MYMSYWYYIRIKVFIFLYIILFLTFICMGHQRVCTFYGTPIRCEQVYAKNYTLSPPSNPQHSVPAILYVGNIIL